VRQAFFLSLVAVSAFGNGLPAPADEPLSASAREAQSASVREFAQSVARDVTQNGPTAWLHYFSQNPAFFMAVNGQLAFADPRAARRGIAALPRVIQQISLVWGPDLRVDALTQGYAVLASSYTEVILTPSGEQHTEQGYFTAVAQRENDTWMFRNVHWSSVPPEPAR
jgi:hypothetical protein